jgi:xylulokinase
LVAEQDAQNEIVGPRSVLKGAKMAILLGIDVGTTGIKALAVMPDGGIAAESFSAYDISSPQPKWAEQNPDDWWDAFCLATRELLSGAIKPDEVAAIGLSGQMHTSVFLDENRKVIRPALLWCDVRTTSQCEQISERVGFELLRDEASNPALEGFTAPKVLWLRDNEPQNYEMLRHLLIAKDYIRYKLTGELATDVSDAAGTILFDVGKRVWSEKILSALEIDPAIMPPVVGSHEISGRITREAAEATGLAEDTPVVGGGADNACAAVGTGIVEEGTVQSSIGSSGVVLAALAEHRVDEKMRLHCMNHAAPDRWYLMGVMLTAGLSLKWFTENLCGAEIAQAQSKGIDVYDLLSEMASTVPAGAEGLIFLPYLSGERTPHADSNARGVFVGLSLRHTKAHMVRAVMEGVAFGLRDSLELVSELGVDVNKIVLVGGGAKSPLWRQIQADIFKQQVCTLSVTDAAPFGAALLAGVGVGAYKSCADAVKATVKQSTETAPIKTNLDLYEDCYSIYRDLYPSNRELFRKISDIA